MRRRPRKEVPKVELLRSFVGKEKDYFEEVFDHDKNTEMIEPIPHVTSRSSVTTNVFVPNQVSDDPREIALKNASLR